MCTTNRFFYLIGFLMACVTGLQAQKAFEGRIYYTIEYIDMPEELRGMEYALPRESLWIVKNGNTRMQQRTVLGGEQVTIHREGTDSVYQLVDVLGQKMRLSMPVNAGAYKHRITEKEDTKSVLGYEAHHAVLQDGNGTVLDAWYTPRFRNPAGGELPSLKGLPLEYEFARSGIRMRMVATQLVEEPVDETYFLIPPDYVHMPKELYDRWLR